MAEEQKLVWNDTESTVETTCQKDESPTESQSSVQRAVPEPQGRPSRPLPLVWAWLQVLGVFFVYLNTWGLVLTFGAFQTYYENDLLSNNSPSSISWIATTCSFLLLIGGLFAGPLFDRGYYPLMTMIGNFLVVFGVMMTSLGTKYYQIFLSQGVCVGIGAALIWVPSLANIVASFPPAERALPMGVVAAGSSIGGLVFPIMFRRLLPQIGFPWTVRVLGFILLFGAAVDLGATLPRRPPRPPFKRSFWDVTAFRDIPFLAQMTSGFFTLIAYFVPVLYLPLYAQTHVHDLPNAQDAYYLLAIVNGASAVGRIGAGVLATKLGIMDTYVGALACSTVLLFGWIAINSFAGIVVWAVLWGIITGLIISMPGVIIPLLSPSLQLVGTRMGMGWVPSAVGILVGSPIAGALLAHEGKQVVWWHLQVFAGIAMFVSVGFCAVPWWHVGLRRRA